MIEPTLGRVVHYHPKDEPGERHAAMIAKVNADGTVNLGCLTDNGVHYSAQNVTLVQDGEPNPGQCEWMAYQKNQVRNGIADNTATRDMLGIQKKLLDSDIAVGPQVFVSPVEKMISEAALMGTAALHVSEAGAEVVTLDDLVAKQDDELMAALEASETDNADLEEYPVVGTEPGDPDFIGPMEEMASLANQQANEVAAKVPKSKVKSYG